MDDRLLPMTEVQTLALTRSRSFLVKNLTLANITNDLVTREVFTDTMLEEIEVEKTPTERKRKLLIDLVRRPKDCYEKFISILKDNGEPHCASEIKTNEELAVQSLQSRQQLLQPIGSRSRHQPPLAASPHQPTECLPKPSQPTMPPQPHQPPPSAPASTPHAQPAGREVKFPVQVTDESRSVSAGTGNIPSTGTSRVGSSSSSLSAGVISDDDLDRRDTVTQHQNPVQLQGAAPVMEPVSEYEKMYRCDPTSIYKHETSPRGMALIINNIEFDDLRLETRDGSESDCEALSKMLTDFGMEVTVLSDLQAKEMEKRIRQFATDDRLSEVDSCVLAVMSHGADKGKICGTDYNYKDDRPFITDENIKDMLNCEHCHHMRNKPKFIIIQACRGDKEDIVSTAGGGVIKQPTEPLADAVEREEEDERPASSPRREHLMADIFTAYSSCSNYKAYRYKDTGSPFIQTLVKVFRERAHDTHVADMVTKVNNMCSEPLPGGKLFITPAETNLRRSFFLNPPRQ